MQIYSVVNVENLKLYEPPMIMDEEIIMQIPSVDDMAPEYMRDLQDDVILDRNIRTSRRGNAEYLRVGLKGMHPSKAMMDGDWKSEGAVPSLACQMIQAFGGPKSSPLGRNDLVDYSSFKLH